MPHGWPERCSVWCDAGAGIFGAPHALDCPNHPSNEGGPVNQTSGGDQR